MSYSRGFEVYKRGANRVWECLFEELNDCRYELDGPHSYDNDYKKQLKEDGYWEADLADWSPPDAERTAHLSGVIEGLEKAIEICSEVAEQRAPY